MEKEPFGKYDFCRAVTGHDPGELFRLINNQFVDPAYEKTQDVGFNKPRSNTDKIAGRYEIFMNTQFQIPLLDIPVGNLYEAFEKFRAGERYNYPRAEYPSNERYWEPVYKRVEDAWRAGDEQEVKLGIIELVDNILHD